MKIFFRRIHLYLSLAAGLVILTACATGAILVFEKELQMAFSKERYFVKQQGDRLPVTGLVDIVKAAFPGSNVNGIKLYEDPTRSAEINISAAQKKVAAQQQAPTAPGSRSARPAGGRQPGFIIFINPYTGTILEKYSYQETFFYQVFALHRWLLGSSDSIGKYIVGISTLIFLFIILTGIILWWPKTKRILLKHLQIRSTAGWKRLNHDLHIVLGFYSAIFLFIFAFTGLAWSFEWFNKGIYTVTASPLQPPPPPKSTPVPDGRPVSPDAALATAKNVFSKVVFYNISLPREATDAISVSALLRKAVHESATDAIYIDQYSGAVLGKLPFSERSLGARVRSAFKPVHTGSIWGTPSKIIAFVVCILGVSFPITGTIMWLNRTRKKARKKAAPAPAVTV
jgi:uncharacterized iron-regulated membrane protein